MFFTMTSILSGLHSQPRSERRTIFFWAHFLPSVFSLMKFMATTTPSSQSASFVVPESQGKNKT